MISSTLIAIIIVLILVTTKDVLQMGRSGFEISDVRKLLKISKFSQSSLVKTIS